MIRNKDRVHECQYETEVDTVTISKVKPAFLDQTAAIASIVFADYVF